MYVLRRTAELNATNEDSAVPSAVFGLLKEVGQLESGCGFVLLDLQLLSDSWIAENDASYGRWCDGKDLGTEGISGVKLIIAHYQRCAWNLGEQIERD